MGTFVNFGIAKVHLLSRKRQSLVALMGVAFGVSLYILLISFMEGINLYLMESMLSSTPDIQLLAEKEISRMDEANESDVGNDFLKNTEVLLADIREDEAVSAASPVLTQQCILVSGPVQVNVRLDGVKIHEEMLVLKLSGKMISGNASDLAFNSNGILLGKGLADKLNIEKGGTVTAFTPDGRMARLRVVGVFQFGLGFVDNTRAFLNIGSVQQLMPAEPGQATAIHIRLKYPDKSNEMAQSFSSRYGIKAEDWTKANASILATVTARNVLTYVVSLALLVVAGFGIYNIINMTITSKMKDIAILKSVGFTGKDIATVFLSQCLVIGLIGSAIGVLAGFGFSEALSRVPFPRSETVSFGYFPVSFKARYYLIGVFFGLATSVLPGLIPAIRASGTDTLSILRR
jgi:lipoprotein-releasing system permease protein